MKLLVRLLLVVIACGVCIEAVRAQDDEDVQSWNDLQLTVPIEKKVDFVTKLTLRFGKNVSRLTEQHFNIGFAWKPTHALTILPYYRYIYARNSAGQFRVENRPSIAVSYKFPTKSFGLTHRSTFERRLREPRNTWRYRAMLTVDKDIPASLIPKAKWFVADEVFYDSATGRFSRNRFSIGITKTISKQLSWDIYYTRQNDGFSHPGDLNIIWESWKIKL